MLADDKRYQLISRLNKSTQADQVHWEITSKDETFQAAFPEHVLRVRARSSQDIEGLDYALAIIDKKGHVLDEFWDTDLTYREEDEKNNVQRPYVILKQLYETARRQALGIDKAFDQLLQQLENLDDVPF